MTKRSKEITTETHEVWIVRRNQNRPENTPEDTGDIQTELSLELIEEISSSSRLLSRDSGDREKGETKNEE